MSEHRQQDESSQASTPRVAIDVLERDIQALLFEGDPTRDPTIQPLVDGFDTRRAAINWWQAAAVRTFGHLASDFPPIQLMSDNALAAALYRDPEADRAERQRQRIIEWTLEAYEIAHRDLETRATEWLGGSDGGQDWTSIDPTSQKHVAMRPSFTKLDEKQARALSRLWGGFEDRQSLMRWAYSLPAVANFAGLFEAGDDSDEGTIADELARDAHALAMMQSTDGVGSFYRERWAISYLLPAFATRAKRLQAGERPVKRTEQSVPSG